MRRLIVLFTFLFLIYSAPLQSQSSSDNGLFASTYLGGASIELFVMELDELGFLQHPNGDVYICGPTESNNFPVTLGAFQPNHAGGTSESFVARLNADLTKLVASTYLGGSAIDIASAMIIDKDGNICVAGHTTSDDFPVTSGAYDTSYVTSFWDEFDVFITILTPDLDSVLASTYLGGSNPDYFNQIRVATDTNGNIIVAGATISGDFPVTPNAYSTTGGYNTGPDLFISKFTPDLSDLLASTYCGGLGVEQALDILVDENNNICVCGITGSSNYPTTPMAYNTTFNGDADAYISMFGNDLDTLLASTFIGGDGMDNAFSMAFNSSGNIYICGYTESLDFPYTSGAYDTTFNYGFYDGFITLIDSRLENLMASTFLGSSGWDFSRDIVYDESSRDVFITGLAGESDFPVTNHTYDTSFNGESDLYISRMDGDLTRLIASTFLGGEWDDFGLELALAADDNIFVAGNTYSDEFPTTPGAYNEESNGSYDATISLIDKELSGQVVGIHPAMNPAGDSKIVLFQNFPNPTKHTTSISFYLPESMYVNIDIHGLFGNWVISLADETFNAGKHVISWNGKDCFGEEIARGIYVIKLSAGKEVHMKKMIVL